MHDFPSPFWWLSALEQRIACAVMLAAMFGLMTYLSHAQAVLTGVVPNGVVELETPLTTNKAAEMIKNLKDAHLIDEARRQTYWDYAFLLVYPIALSLGCAIAAGATSGKTAIIGMCISWGVLLACPVDAVENFAILKMLGERTTMPWPLLATICACIKFTLAGGGLLFVLYALVIKGWECIKIAH
ncbi:hypothetical protein SAMN04487926_10817 [Paraburkholderia steynii]|uniref:Uncharacterized protein n=2 Tax=Paraburkholderia steynii TaxID=1245441 RepID=A0A7Z7B5X5_9BURK|nr:hypothetical protein SAMN04487926_10817 [Paraburkholderia steynii]